RRERGAQLGGHLLEVAGDESVEECRRRRLTVLRRRLRRHAGLGAHLGAPAPLGDAVPTPGAAAEPPIMAVTASGPGPSWGDETVRAFITACSIRLGSTPASFRNASAAEGIGGSWAFIHAFGCLIPHSSSARSSGLV